MQYLSVLKRRKHDLRLKVEIGKDFRSHVAGRWRVT
jgi:hypothetical protein